MTLTSSNVAMYGMSMGMSPSRTLILNIVNEDENIQWWLEERSNAFCVYKKGNESVTDVDSEHRKRGREHSMVRHTGDTTVRHRPLSQSSSVIFAVNYFMSALVMSSELFISEVQKHPSLGNMNHVDHHNRLMNYQLWTSVGELANFPSYLISSK
ncbi:hypothetical protein J6590_069132 [Homalodisca vitripennis]|nr:hypothetical protein J6590_069132 [Homalodisca vitripennis]